MEDLTVLGERVTSFEERLLGIEGKVGELENRVSANEVIDAQQAVEIAELQESVERLKVSDTLITSDLVELDMKQRSSAMAELERAPISMVFMGGSAQEIGSGQNYEYPDEDIVWARYPNTTTLIGGGAGVHFAGNQMFGFGLEGRGFAATAGGSSVEVLALPMVFVDKFARVDVHMITGWQMRSFPYAGDAPSFVRESEKRAFTKHGFALGAGLGITLIGYGANSGELPGELVLRPEIKVMIGDMEQAYGSMGLNFIWRIGLVAQ